MIAVIDYGAGNLASVRRGLVVAAQVVCSAVGELAPAVRVTGDPAVVADAMAVVLPGVGAFGDAVTELRRCGLEDAIAEAFIGPRPFLGICLGLQILFPSSEESPGIPGLGLVSGSVRRFRDVPKVPHMGWNQLEAIEPNALLRGIPDRSYAYFVHSYYADPDDSSLVTSWSEYGGRFCSSIGTGTAFACQFHPEKSQRVGLRILQNFVRVTIHAADPSD